MPNPCPHCGQHYYHKLGCVVYLAKRSHATEITENFPPEARTSTGLFVAVKKTVMRGSEFIASACSFTMARRIARALNEHKTNSRGI